METEPYSPTTFNAQDKMAMCSGLAGTLQDSKALSQLVGQKSWARV